MKICHITPHYLPSFAGITTVIREISYWELKNGHEVSVLCYFPWKPWRETDVREEIIEGVKVRRINNFLMTEKNYFLGRMKNRFFLPFKFFSALSGEQFDIIHISGIHHLTYSAIIYCRLKKIPAVISLYGEELRVFEKSGSAGFIKSIKLKLRFLLNKLIYKCVDDVSCSSKSLKIGLKQLGLRDESGIIFNGVNLSKLPVSLNKECDKSKKKYFIPDNKIIVGSVGGISARKGYDILIDAFSRAYKKNRNLHLAIVGGGDIDSLRKIAIEKGVLEKISFLGALTYEELLTVYPVFDIYVQLPRQEEGVSQTALEAQMLEKPVIASDCGAMRDSVDDGNSGFIIPIEKHDQIAEKIIMFAEDENLRTKMGKAGRKWVADNFSYEKIADEYIKMFEDVIRKRKKVKK